MIAKQEDLNSENVLQLEAMNTNFHFQVMNCLKKDWKNIISDWIHYVETEWSRFRNDNELFRLNELSVGEQMIVPPPLFDILQKAEDYRKKTKGFFSPYLLPQISFHGYDQAFPFSSALSNDFELPSVYNQMDGPFEFEQGTNTVKRIYPGKLDLGGIGKGYAVQSAGHWLKEIGQARAGIVDGGGDITVWSDGEKEWTIGVAHPYEKNKEIAQFRVKNASAATSNILYRRWQQGNEQKHHLLNGKTGLPVECSIIQATVVSENLLDAEVAAKLCFMEHHVNEEFKKMAKVYLTILVDKNGDIEVQR
ncbi:MAG: FAD:protein FMN transferase [Bacillota bacterium]|nr:FAD:protein FMN transferase [Bacillota bacterium]